MDKLLPLLKSCAWLREHAAQGLLSQPLPGLPPALAEQASQLLYVLDQGHSLAYLQAGDHAEQLPALHQAALATLRSALANTDWLEFDEQREGIHLRFLALSEHFNAAEGLLLPERLLEAHALLDASHLLACTPARGLLLVCPYDTQQPVAQELFVSICLEHYQEAVNEQISPIIWGVDKGVIKDRLTIRAATSSPLAATEPKEEAVEPEQSGAPALHYYTPLQIAFMTIFGTVVAGLYGLAVNYKRFGAAADFRMTLAFAAVVVPGSLLLFLSLPGTPYDRLFPVISALCTGGLARVLQRAKLRAAFNAGGKRQTVLNQVVVIGVSLLLLLPLLAVFIATAMD